MDIAYPPNSLLGLPRELRDLIYEYCSPPDLSSYLDRGTLFSWGPPAKPGPVSLLRVCKQVHAEAAPCYYGNKPFVFSIGWSSGSTGSVLGLPRRTCSLKYFDNTSWIAPYYLKMIKTCVVNVEPLPGPTSAINKSNYLALKARLHTFGECLGNRHSLELLYIRYGMNEVEKQIYRILKRVERLQSPRRSAALQKLMAPVQRMENVVEPLTEIYNVTRVSVDGLHRDLAAKVGRAIACGRHKAVSPREETYKIRMVKVKGHGRQKQPRRYRDSKYDDSKLIWNGEHAGPLPPPPNFYAFVATRQVASGSTESIYLDPTTQLYRKLYSA